jgi:hypothetical protein
MRILSSSTVLLHEIPFDDAARGGGVERKRLPILRVSVDALPPSVGAILACSDLQGTEPAQPTRPKGQRARLLPGRGADAPPRLLGELLAAELVEVGKDIGLPPTERIGVLLAGDLYVRPDLGRRGGRGDVRSVWLSFAKHFRWVVGVAGNHDDFGSDEEFWHFYAHEGIHFLDGDVREVDDLRVAGVSGIIGDLDWPRRRPEADFVACLHRSIDLNPAVLLLHQGPDVPNAGLPGHPVINAALQRRNLLVVCGHTHWHTPLATFHGSQILNVHERAVLLMVSEAM